MTLRPDHFVPFYQDLSPAEDRERTNVHYMLPARFFTTFTGGDWHVYSCNLWGVDAKPDVRDPSTQTQAQERKLDAFARLLELAPGKRLLDIGCAWGGPLLYLCKKYDVVGHGIALSEHQLDYAREWAARLRVACTFELCHWEDLAPTHRFDAVMSDEAIVHVHRLEVLFRKVASVLVPGGIMVNKELHFGHPRFGLGLSRASTFINALFGGTGNYRSLGDELQMANAAGFAVDEVWQVPTVEYVHTLASWRANLFGARAELVELVGIDVFTNFTKYLMLLELMVRGRRRQMELHFVKCRKLEDA
jgi:cyclopropane-fatty-acyl-phospholipid synthase